jgi:amino acid transporter
MSNESFEASVLIATSVHRPKCVNMPRRWSIAAEILPKTVFAREATGVIRSISPLQASIVGMMVLNFGSAFSISFATTVTVLPGANVGLGFLLAIPFVIVNAVAYQMLGTTMPRSGGDYVWISRGVHSGVGFGLEFVTLVFQALFFGAFGEYAIGGMLAGGAGALGVITGNTALLNFTTFLGTNTGLVLFSTLLVVMAFAVLVMPLHRYLKIQLTLWVLGIISTILFFVVLLSTSPTGFVSSFNSFFAPYNMTYAQVISSAQAAGFTNPGLVTWGSPTWLSVPYLFFVLVGFEWPALVGGEMKNAKKGMFYGIVVTGVAAALIEAGGSFLLQWVAGPSFLNAAAYLTSVGQYGGPVPFNPFILALVITHNLAVDVFMAVGLVCWGAMMVIGGTFLYSRVILAWGFDRALPAKISYVSERFHTPVIAVTIFAILVEIGALFSVYYGVIFSQMNVTLVLILLFAFVGLAAALLPYRQKSMFEQSPYGGWKIAGVPTMTWVGAINFVVFLGLSYFALQYPSLSGPTGPTALGVILGVFLVGVIGFYITRAYYKSKGIDTSLAFKEIPPE